MKMLKSDISILNTPARISSSMNRRIRPERSVDGAVALLCILRISGIIAVYSE